MTAGKKAVMGDHKVNAQCPRCEGTGILKSFLKPKGWRACLCFTCQGTGCLKVYYIPFQGRKPVRGIREVVYPMAWTNSPTGKMPKKAVVTYKEFKAGKMPKG